MANIAIFRINYKSDFILTLNSDAGWMTPFCIKFWTGAPSQAYFVGYDGTTYTHCAPVAGDPTKLEVQFDDHHLPIGDLKFQIGYHFTVADFPTTVEDEVINQAAVIIEVDNSPAQVMLDLNGETAPEIQFSLPAYANEAQRIANEEQRIANETQRIGNEETRIQHEELRIAAEQTRQQNEQQRINQEQARVNEFAVLKRESEQATTDANNAAENARQKAQLAQDKATLAQAAAQLANDKAALAQAAAQLANDKAALAQAAAQLANDKAQLAADKAALAQAASQLCDEKAALAQQKATYAQQQGDYSKAQGDYAKEQGDYSKAQGDYSKEQGDYSKEQGDYAKDKGDICAADHQTAVADHQTATTDHNQAVNDHTRAESDHTRAESDHAAVEMYVDSLGVFDLSKHNAVGGVLATYADLSAALTALNALDSKYKYGGMSFKFVCTSDNNYVQFRYMPNDATTVATFTNIANWQGVDDEPTAGSDNLVKSGGVDKKTGNIVSKDGNFSIVDENGYIGAVIGNEGLTVKDVYIKINGSFLSIENLITEISQSLSETGDDVDNISEFLSKSFKESEDFYITDENGYIAFKIGKNGNITDSRGDSNVFCKKIVFRGEDYTPNQSVITIPASDVQIPYSGRLELPSKINVLQNSISEIYFEQMLGGGFLRDYMISYDTSVPYQRQCDRAFVNTNTIGEIERKFYLWNTFGSKIEEKNMQVGVVDKSVSGNIKICVIGDSMTENAKKLYELANLAANDNSFTISFLGARTSTGTDSDGNTRTVKHCGYSGKNIVDVCQLESYGSGKPNIFYDGNVQTTNKFSIAKGIEFMEDVPDVIIIDHGANQAGVAWETVKGCYDFIINDVNSYNAANNTDIKIVICVQQPGGLSEKVIPTVPNKWNRISSPTKLINYINEYDGREDDGIYLLPQYLFIDPYKDYPRANVPYSTRNTSLREVSLDNTHMGINMNGYDTNHAYSYGEICTDGNQNGYVSLKNNNTEPLSDDKINWARTKDDVNAGYWKLADAYFAELKYIVSL